MAKDQEVERIAKKLDKMVQKKNSVSTERVAASAEKTNKQKKQPAVRWWSHLYLLRRKILETLRVWAGYWLLAANF